MSRALAPIAFLSLFLVGCSGGTLPPETDATQGRAVFAKVMDTWIAGGKPEQLKSDPQQPIIVADPDWSAGKKLTKYDVDPADDRAGVDLLLKVTLTFDGGQKKTVNFAVALGTSATVVTRKE